MLYLTAGKRRESIRLKKVEHALTQELSHDAHMIAEIETIPQMDTFVAIVSVVLTQRLQHSQFNLCSIAILRHGPDNLDCDSGLESSIVSFDHLTEGPLA